MRKTNSTLTADKVREYFTYDSETGQFFWKVSPSRSRKVGSTVQCRAKYDFVFFEKNKVSLTLLAWLHFYGSAPLGKIGFLDGNPKNLRIENLQDFPCRGAPVENPNAEQLRNLYTYDSSTGRFSRKVKTYLSTKLGEVLGSNSGKGYLIGQAYKQMRFLGKLYPYHRLAWLYVTGSWPPKGIQIDHINQDKQDNRFCNFRLATNSENLQNRGLSKSNKTGYKGVYFSTSRPKPWSADITVGGRKIYLGCFNEKEEAVHARRTAEVAHYPFRPK